MLHYPIPWGLAFRIVGSILVRETRSFQEDAHTCIEKLPAQLQVFGQEHIPSSGPGLLTINHYYRLGFHAWWLPLAVSSLVPSKVHWVMTAALTFPGQPYASLRTWVSRRILAKIAWVYDFSPMPAMPPDPEQVSDRAQAVRQILAYIRKTPNPLLGLAPEGYDNLAGGLMWPPSGVGRFIYHLSRYGLEIFPIGVYESETSLCLRFGEPYRLDIQEGVSPDQRDCYAIEEVMHHIAALLPRSLRGVFS